MAKRIGTTVVLLLLVIVLGNSFYVVKEDELAVVSLFGRINRAVINDEDYETVSSSLTSDEVTRHIKIVDTKGLKFKIPFVENVQKYDSKYLTYQSVTETVNTKDSKRIEINMYAQYRIIDPVKFQKVVKTTEKANTRMDENVYSEIVKSCNSLNQNEFFYENTLEALLDNKHMELNEEMITNYGIYISDIGIYRKNFPAKNIESIEQKMISQIEKESRGLIAEGDALYTRNTALTDLKTKTILSEAIENAAKIKAKADAESVRIYTDSLSKDLEFYQFIRRMDIYENMYGTTVFVDDDGIFDMIDGYGNIE